MTILGTIRPKTAARLPLTTRAMRRLTCRILGHRWHFIHDHDEVGKVYRCWRCQKQAIFIR